MTQTTPASVDQSSLDSEPAGTSRRRVLIGGGVVLVAAAATAACGSSSSSTAPATTSTPSTPAAATSAPASGGGTTVKTSDVPVGGGDILTADKVVITQPSAGTYKAFTAVCTHQGCLVASVADGLIKCPCHGSEYSIVDGSVKGGPAPAPLEPVAITVSGSTITLT